VLPKHPTLGLNLPEPVLNRGNPAEVFKYVLLADEPDWDYPAGRDHDRGAKNIFQHEDARGVMPEGSVPKISHVLLAGVEPLVQVQIIARFAAVLLG
jgi:hypothetical protein